MLDDSPSINADCAALFATTQPRRGTGPDNVTAASSNPAHVHKPVDNAPLSCGQSRSLLYNPNMPTERSTRRKTGSKARQVAVAPPSLPPDQVQALWDFVRFGLGHPYLTAWEENFLNGVKHRLYAEAVWLTDKQHAIVRQIKDKLHYDRPDDPLPPLDPDGIHDDDDPDGWPAVRTWADPFDDDESVGGLAAR
jgi:hypothetical protein